MRLQAHTDLPADLFPGWTAVVTAFRHHQEGNEVTLLRILVYMIAETNRHAGHADIVRELIDGAAGWRPGDDSLPVFDKEWWESYRSRLERVARESGKG